MPSASVVFYGRRSRSSRTFDDLAAASSSSSSSSSSDPSATINSHHHRQRRRSDHDSHRRHRHINLDEADHNRPPPRLPHPSFLSPLPKSEPRQREKAGESFPGDANNREIVRDLSGRYCRSNRLPVPVLLAKERLLQRLRGVPVSGARQNRETSPSFHCNDIWVFDADWETIGFQDLPTSDAILIESPSEPHQQSSPEEIKKKSLGLTKETLSQLHHEVFMEYQKSKASNECSICLENFEEGNELVSLPCGHKFHTSCLYPWLRTCGDCPYCRSCIMLVT